MNLIDGVKIKKLNRIPDERGRLMELMRNDEEFFTAFGQVYVTTCNPGIVKAWHYHKKQEDNFFCVKGMIKLGLYDNRPGSPTQYDTNTLYLGDWNTIAVKIPENVYHGFMCVSTEEAIIINCSTMPYNRKKPDEHRVPFDAFENYDWSIKNG